MPRGSRRCLLGAMARNLTACTTGYQAINGSVVVAGLVPWEQLAGAVRGMYSDDQRSFELEPDIAVERPGRVPEPNGAVDARPEIRERIVAYYDAEKRTCPTMWCSKQ